MTVFQEQKKDSTFTLKNYVISLYPLPINSSFSFTLYFVFNLPDLREAEKPATVQVGPLGSKICRRAKHLLERLKEAGVWGK